ncbi:PREDICTED: uncharacterized protein MAL13P1.304-like [Papilio xuthus]|uniref:Uncharacterized protein MAL13P1.304-like n=1 Tax=Papilio xuthus TaxID=66420 RepID=A0AAJ7EG30_PAPXU|nr:PREDICTED: uncharacterized protein MAL13P1.304-like [Papilio xuthus]
MQCLPVIFLLISSVYGSDEASKERSDNVEITTRANYGMIGDISNKGRRYNVDDTIDVVKDNKEESNIATDETETPLIPFSRIVRSFDFYNDLYDSYRRKNMKENKNNDPKNILNDIRTRNTQSNAYNEDQERRMFFSHIFSLFDDDKNTRRSGKSNEKNKHSKSHFDHEIDNFKNPKARTEQPIVQYKHDSHKKTSLKRQDMEPEYDSFESTIESYLNGKRLSNNQYNDDNETKHKKKNKGRHHSRPERQLADMGSFEIVENQTEDDSVGHQEFIPNKMITNRKRKNTYEEIDSQSSLINSDATSTPEAKIEDEKDSSETAYLIRTPSFNYYQTNVTYGIPNDEKPNENEDDKPDNDAEVFEVQNTFNNTENEVNIQESVTFIPDVQNTITYEQNTESVSQDETINIAKDDKNTSIRKPINIVEEFKNNQSHVTDIDSEIMDDLVGKDTRRINYINVNEEISKETKKPIEISTVKEEIETPEQELKVTKDYIEAIPSNIRNPLSARIKLDVLIQFPSQIDIGNEI